jgi:hypothetical protein
MRRRGTKRLAVLAAILAGLLWAVYWFGPETWLPSPWEGAAGLIILVVLGVLSSAGAWALVTLIAWVVDGFRGPD